MDVIISTFISHTLNYKKSSNIEHCKWLLCYFSGGFNEVPHKFLHLYNDHNININELLHNYFWPDNIIFISGFIILLIGTKIYLEHIDIFFLNYALYLTHTVIWIWNFWRWVINLIAKVHVSRRISCAVQFLNLSDSSFMLSIKVFTQIKHLKH